jgi:alpha-ketoglutaric semialdehyde dehydrogenase
MELHGKSIIAGEPSPDSESESFRGYDPALGQELDPPYYQASEADIARAFEFARAAVGPYRQKSPEEIAKFLEAIAVCIEALGDELISRVSAETGLPDKRFIGERARTVGQLRMFAYIVREGSWVEATIDVAQPERKPLPKPDVRRMLIPLGPVVVFGASNFPLAFSVAGGDTASALAAGNPVIVKAHPAHPGTSELVASAIAQAAEETGMPSGVFSLLHGTTPEFALKLVRHPVATAVGFTGSLRAGRAIYDAAAQRPNPIPVYAEMGSVNPVFVLPGALRESGDEIAAGLHQSVTLGVGQLCTCPGLVVGLRDQAMDKFVGSVNDLFAGAPPATMLHPGILRAYQDGLKRLGEVEGVEMQSSAGTADENRTEAQAAVFVTTAETFLEHEELSEEVFGPSTLLVSCVSKEEIMTVAHNLQGHLTATIHGTSEDLVEYKELVELLQRKVGRLVFNGFPTGVEVCAAIHHGGPYPATSDVRSTSVGAYAIKRFARPICFQNFPQGALPVELRDHNERGIWRVVDNEMTRDEIL